MSQNPADQRSRRPGSSEPSDARLVAAARNGDEQAFEALYERYRDWVYNLAYRFTRDRDDATDVVQDTFAYVVRKLPTLRLRARFTTFLYPVVRSCSISIIRKRRATGIDPHEAEAFLLATPDPPRPDLEELAQVLQTLGPDHRETVELRFVRGMSMEEISIALGIPVGTVKSRIHHATRALRQDPRTRAYFGIEDQPSHSE